MRGGRDFITGVVARNHKTCLSDLLHEADAHLFRKMANNKQHRIHQLSVISPPAKILPMKLRHSRCLFALPQCRFNLYKRSFVMRSSFDYAY